MTSLIDQCPNHSTTGCQGRLRIVSLTREERMQRRIGRAWLGRCSKCGAEQIIVVHAWKTFLSQQKRRKTEEGYERSVKAGEVFRFENPGVEDEFHYDDD